MKRSTFFIKMITSSLIRRRSRMLVALLAIAIGATILSGLVTIYYDVPRQMGAQFRSYGANMIFTASGSEGITMDDVSAGLALIDGAELVGVAPYRYESVMINQQPVIAAGTDMDGVKSTSPYWFVDGEWPSESGEILVGKSVASTFGLGVGGSVTVGYITDTTGERVTDEGTNTMTFAVAGILDTGGKEENYIFISMGDMEALTEKYSKLDVAELSVSANQAKLQEYVENISTQVPSLTPSLVRRVTQSETTVLTKLQSLVLLVTVTVLLLTMICVTTTMLAVVSERRKEIALRKALGASDGGIVGEFMGEGLLLGGIGGLLGALLGFAFAQMVSRNVFNSSIHFLPIMLPITVLVSIIVTGAACMPPVRNTIQVDPAKVLKGE